MAENKLARLLNQQSIVNFCSNCAFPVEKSYHFCPKCGDGIKANANVVDDGNVDRKKELETPSTSSSKFSLPSFALPSFAAFKSTKEKERQSFFSKKSSGPNKKRKVQVKEVIIQVGVIDDCLKIKRGETIPLKVNSLATHDEILAAAIKKHGDFNKRFDSESNYQLIFKDGSNVNFIPGTDPPESFTLQRYKELSGFGFSRIVLYLSPDNHEPDNHDPDMIDTGSEEENDVLPPATWLTSSNDYPDFVEHEVEGTNNIVGQGKSL
jgi:hypothetical protein